MHSHEPCSHYTASVSPIVVCSKEPLISLCDQPSLACDFDILSLSDPLLLSSLNACNNEIFPLNTLTLGQCVNLLPRLNAVFEFWF